MKHAPTEVKHAAVPNQLRRWVTLLRTAVVTELNPDHRGEVTGLQRNSCWS